MRGTSRRRFLKGGAGAVAALGLGSVRGAEPSGRIVVGVIGPGGMGLSLLQSFAAEKDVSVAWVCDPDEDRMRRAAGEAEKISGAAPQQARDLRKVLDDRSVDAVIVATPDHWHGPATVLACEAGKHVYVEKPCSHNVREGRLMVEAARRAKRVVQVGTQSRSAEHLRKGIELLRSGAIGEVLVAKAWNSQRRGNIGKAPPSAPPPALDFDLWLGPAPEVPYRSNLLHASWRWFHAFGTGDIGNDGVHDIDIARWGLGVDVQPVRVAGLGRKLFFDDDQQFPDTQYVVFEYAVEGGKRKQLVYEQRIWSPYVQEGHENGNAFYGTEGMMVLGKQSGWQVFGPRNEPRESVRAGLDGKPHHRNFLECIRSGERPNADIEVGHLSASLAHLGNIAARVGRTLRLDSAAERIEGDEEAAALLRRTYRPGHWAIPAGV